MFKKIVVVAFSCIVLTSIGCSEPDPQVIDMDEIAAEAGLSEGDYIVHENGAMQIKSKVDDTASSVSDEPLAATGESWQYAVSNGVRTADAYAVENNPNATFIGNDVQASLVKQNDGDYEGEYLLTIVNKGEGRISYAQLRPLFDVNESSDELDDESQLWEVTVAKYNGQKF